ncbi:hypothetical protein [Undibacterium terreum]|uniref:Uncharacterized protein n=1 Tax=Undibacterium terreum TaxID=1224302 RepID=A0A916U971_9BURK|nr:hypothetical protein [Undibacterium terreum]GGC63823.1 hypothetical protein GCM10011396_08520 [Undibacterium terreum]
MPRYLLIAAIGLFLLVILSWTEKSGHPLPKWAWMTILLPFLWLTSSDDDDYSIFGDSSNIVSNIVFLIASVAAMGLGLIALALRGQGSLLEIFVFMLPVGVLLFLFVVAKAWFDSK